MTPINLLFLIFTATAVMAAPQHDMYPEYPDPETDPVNPNVDYYEVEDSDNIAGFSVYLLLLTEVNRENKGNGEDDIHVHLNILLTIIGPAEETSPNLMESFGRKVRQVMNKNENESLFDCSSESLVRDLKSGKRDIAIFNVSCASKNLELNH